LNFSFSSFCCHFNIETTKADCSAHASNAGKQIDDGKKEEEKCFQHPSLRISISIACRKKKT
jgi:hypothetical protein